MYKFVVSVLLLMTAVSGTALAAGDPSIGRTKASACTACHGLTGVSENQDWPNLAGQKPVYLSKQLRAFRDGSRTNPLMTAMAKPLSDEDIEDLTAYFTLQSPAPAVAPKPTVDVSALPHAP